MMRKLKAISVVLLVLVPALFPISGQGRSAGRAHNLRASKLTGIVLDENDSRIVGATVRIENEHLYRVVRSSDEGAFEIELPAGVYRLTVEMDGFKRFVLSPLRLRPGARGSVNIRMKIEPPQMPLKIE